MMIDVALMMIGVATSNDSYVQLLYKNEIRLRGY
jgi:hypothetical protein